MTKATTWTPTRRALGVLAVTLAIATPVAASSDNVKLTLQPTGVDADASGSGKVKIRDRRGSLSGKLELRAHRLDASSDYQVTIDGVRIGTLTTGSSGNGRARFRSDPKSSRDQLLGVDPRGHAIAIVDGGGAVVLNATAGSGSHDDNDVRCCLPDDSGPECEDRTSTECAAEGGVDLGPGSCLPNPCDDVTPAPAGDDIVCCIPDDSGPECEDRTPAECSAQGGIVVEATSCDSNPCQTTPPGGTTSSTVPGGGGGNGIVVVTCERRSDRSRGSVNGKNLASGNYRARFSSGANTATAGPAGTIGDEVEFDFDSEPDDIAAGATAIGTGFLQGNPPQATGEILNSANEVVASATVTCEIH